MGLSPAHESLVHQLQYKTSPRNSCFPQLPLGRIAPSHPAHPWGPLLIMSLYKASQRPSWFISRLLRKVAKGVFANNKGPVFVRRLQSQMLFCDLQMKIAPSFLADLLLCLQVTSEGCSSVAAMGLLGGASSLPLLTSFQLSPVMSFFLLVQSKRLKNTWHQLEMFFMM